MTNPVAFSRPLADGRDYRKPAFPMLPHVPGSKSPRPRPCPADVGATLLSTHARYGLAIIARAKLREGDIVLLPAYHCPALVEPFLWIGCRIRFYAMNKDLSPRPEGFEEQLKAARAVVLVRYFGFDGTIENLATLARGQDCVVIEDLAHAPFIQRLYGDFGVTSLPKFYPVTSGAEIWLAPGEDSDALKHILEYYRQSPLRWQLTLGLYKLRRRLPAGVGAPAEATNPFCYFQEEGLREPVSRRAMAEISRHDATEAIASRRKNYQILEELLKNSGAGSPLYSRLGDTDVPYVFPYILKNADNFDKIRNAGIPLFRWEELAASDCEITRAYRSTLIQVPCHQDLTDEDLGLIETTFMRLEA